MGNRGSEIHILGGGLILQMQNTSETLTAFMNATYFSNDSYNSMKVSEGGKVLFRYKFKDFRGTPTASPVSAGWGSINRN